MLEYKPIRASVLSVEYDGKQVAVMVTCADEVQVIVDFSIQSFPSRPQALAYIECDLLGLDSAYKSYR